MKSSAEKVSIMLALFLLALASIEMFVVSGGPLTREEVIEISRNAPVVQDALSKSSGEFVIDIAYWNASHLAVLKPILPGDASSKLPADHGVWWISWDITPPGYQIAHFIDEFTGQILYENKISGG